MTARPMSRQLKTTLAIATLGAVLALISFYPYFGGKDVCSAIGASCDSVIATTYGTAFGLPVQLPAVLVFLAVVTICAHNADCNETWVMLGVMMGVASATSLWLLLVSFTFLRTWCLFCVLTHMVVFVLTGYVFRVLWMRARNWVQTVGPAVPIVVLLAIVAIATWYWQRPMRVVQSVASGTLERPLWSWNSRSQLATAIIDPSCPHCAASWPEYVADFNLRLAIYPVDTECAQLAKAIDSVIIVPAPEETRLGACRLGAHVFCAGQQGRAGEYLSIVFARTREKGAQIVGRWDGAAYLELAKEAKLDMEFHFACTGETQAQWRPNAMHSPYRQWYAQHVARAARLVQDGGGKVPLLTKH